MASKNLSTKRAVNITCELRPYFSQTLVVGVAQSVGGRRLRSLTPATPCRTDAEFTRRQSLVATLKGRRDDLQSSFSRAASDAPDRGRSELFSAPTSAAAASGRGRGREDENTRALDHHGLLEQQSQIMRGNSSRPESYTGSQVANGSQGAGGGG